MKRQPQKNRSLLLFSVPLLLIFLSAGYFTFSSFRSEPVSEKGRATPPADKPPISSSSQGVTAPPVRGNAKGVVLIEEFSDFQCPFCARSVPVLKQIMEEFPSQVRWEFRHFPVVSSHPNAPLIHMAALAAGKQGRFWEMHDKVFENRDRVSLQDLLGYADGLGLDLKAFEASLKDERLMTRIETDYNEGADRMVRATPTFFVNGRKIEGAIPYPLFKREVELAILSANRNPPSAP